MKKIHEIVIICLLVLAGLLMGGCASVIDEAGKAVVPDAVQPVIKPDPVPEQLLVEAFDDEGIDWYGPDLKKVLMARGTLQMVEEYLAYKRKAGPITYFTLKETFDFVMFSYSKYEEGLDGRASQDGVLTPEQAWIYQEVKTDLWSDIDAFRNYLDVMAQDINQAADAITLENFKSAASVVAGLTGVKLPIDDALQEILP